MTTASAARQRDAFWSDVDPEIVSELTTDQMAAIAEAAERREARDRPADIRLSFGRYFLVVICGRERRNRERLRAERVERPVFIRRNLPLLFGLWGSIFYTAYSAFSVLVRTAFQFI